MDFRVSFLNCYLFRLIVFYLAHSVSERHPFDLTCLIDRLSEALHRSLPSGLFWPGHGAGHGVFAVGRSEPGNFTTVFASSTGMHDQNSQPPWQQDGLPEWSWEKHGNTSFEMVCSDSRFSRFLKPAGLLSCYWSVWQWRGILFWRTPEVL